VKQGLTLGYVNAQSKPTRKGEEKWTKKGKAEGGLGLGLLGKEKKWAGPRKSSQKNREVTRGHVHGTHFT